MAEPTEERFIPNYTAGEVSYLWSSRADLDAFPGTNLQVQEAGIKAPIPLYRNDSSRLVTGVDFRWSGLDFDGPAVIADRLDLYRVQVPFDFWHSFNDRWKAWGRVAPGLFTDFENLDDDAFAITVLALGSYQFNPTFSAAAGVYYSRDLGEDRLLPALGLIWKPDPRWNIGLTFPRASVAYAPTDEWLLSVYAAPGGSGWSVTDEATGQNRRLDYQSWRAAIGAEYQFTKVGPAKLWAFIAGGWQFGQELQLRDGDLTLLESDLDSSQFISGGVRLRF